MYDPRTTEGLLNEIEESGAYLTQAERLFFHASLREFEDEGSLDTNSILELYELRDRLDGRTGRRSEQYDFDSADVW